MLLRLHILLLLAACYGRLLAAQPDSWWLRQARAIKEWVDTSDIAGCDTAYIRQPREGFIAQLNASLDGSHMYLSDSQTEGMTRPMQSVILSAHPTVKVSAGLSYRGWGLSYSHGNSRYGDTDFMQTFYSRRYGLEFRYHDAYSLSGTIYAVDGQEAELPLDIRRGRLRTATVNGYWVFDHKHFSHSAAMLGTAYQLRSCGSWLAGLSYWHASYNSYQDDIGLDFRRLSLSHLNVSGGYAYNHVFGQGHFLLHTSCIPMVQVWHRNRYYFDDCGRALRQTFSADILAHLHLIYNHDRYIVGCQTLSDYSFQPLKAHFSASFFDWNCRFFVGMRF